MYYMASDYVARAFCFSSRDDMIGKWGEMAFFLSWLTGGRVGFLLLR